MTKHLWRREDLDHIRVFINRLKLPGAHVAWRQTRYETANLERALNAVEERLRKS